MTEMKNEQIEQTEKEAPQSTEITAEKYAALLEEKALRIL